MLPWKQAPVLQQPSERRYDFVLLTRLFHPLHPSPALDALSSWISQIKSARARKRLWSRDPRTRLARALRLSSFCMIKCWNDNGDSVLPGWVCALPLSKKNDLLIEILTCLWKQPSQYGIEGWFIWGFYKQKWLWKRVVCSTCWFIKVNSVCVCVCVWWEFTGVLRQVWIYFHF